MKQLKEEAKKGQSKKLRNYAGHSDIAEDKALIREAVKPSALKPSAQKKIPHKADGGPILGGDSRPALGRHRKNSGKGTTVNIIIAGRPGMGGEPGAPGASAPPAPPPLPMPPPAALAPKGIPAGGPAGPPVPPLPMRGAGPMKRGGSVKKKAAK
jgi:hypothetical protein